MAQMLKVARRHRAFERADILSLMGETICGVERQIPPQKAAKVAPVVKVIVVAQVARLEDEEDAERWDGLG